MASVGLLIIGGVSGAAAALVIGKHKGYRLPEQHEERLFRMVKHVEDLLLSVRDRL